MPALLWKDTVLFIRLIMTIKLGVATTLQAYAFAVLALKLTVRASVVALLAIVRLVFITRTIRDAVAPANKIHDPANVIYHTR